MRAPGRGAGLRVGLDRRGARGDQFSILTACATATSRILLGTSITSVFVRSAPTIAMAAACVDHYSNGRFILGLGSSHKVQVEPEHGLTFAQPVQRLQECIGIVSPNPPKDGARTGEGGKGVTGAMIRARIRVDGRLAGGLQALLGAPMSACSGCGERDGRIGHGKRRSRTGMA